jgi:hypothetical protein
MSIDRRTRLHKDFREIPRDEIFESMLPDCIERNGELAGRGLAYKELPAISLVESGRSITLRERNGKMVLEEGKSDDTAVAVLLEGALSELLQDKRSTMGLAMNSMVELERGGMSTWIGWEPIFRALVDGRSVHETGDVRMLDRDGLPLDLNRSFDLDDDRDEISHFFHQAGFLHLTNIFNEEEMASVAADIDEALLKAKPDDGESWWAGDSNGVQMPVRILNFHERSATLRELIQDDRLTWIGKLTQDGHANPRGAEGLIKPLDIRTGLSDLPWHKDCGQGGHSYQCAGLTTGISVTGADGKCGALGVVPGSHRANTQTASLDPNLDLVPRKLETATGDVTVHCSDTFHKAHHPIERPRKVVYTGFWLPPKPEDVIPVTSKSKLRADRARLTNVRTRIEASDQS